MSMHKETKHKLSLNDSIVCDAGVTLKREVGGVIPRTATLCITAKSEFF